MLSTEFLNYLSTLIDFNINTIQSVSGGDISAAYLVKSSNCKFFLKVNSNPWALDMFKVEAQGLKVISNTNTISTPEVIAFDTFKNESFILMEYVESKSWKHPSIQQKA